MPSMNRLSEETGGTAANVVRAQIAARAIFSAADLDAFAAVVGDATVWHQACWKTAGSPMDYRGPSAPSPDQGWFFEDGAHDLPEPGTGRG